MNGSDPHWPTNMMGSIAKPAMRSDWRSSGQLVLLLLRRLVDDQLKEGDPIIANIALGLWRLRRALNFLTKIFCLSVRCSKELKGNRYNCTVPLKPSNPKGKFEEYILRPSTAEQKEWQTCNVALP